MPLRTIPTSDTPRLTDDLPPPEASLASEIEREDRAMIVDALAKAMTIADQYDPRRNPGRSMRQLRTLFSSSRLRAAMRRYEAEKISLG
jgi:hypothetical protein